MDKTLTEQAMDAYLANSDLGGASPQAGDQIAGLIWSYIEEVVEEGVLDLDQIVEEASSRAEDEIEQILNQDWAMAEDEECDA